MAATGQQTVAAILVAGGLGERLGAGTAKAFCTVAGATLLEHACARFVREDVRDLIVVVPADYVGTARDLVPGPLVVSGGATRQDSVARALQVLPDGVNTILVHDVARPFVPAAVIDRVLAALCAGASAVIPAVAVADTVTCVRDGVVVQTLERASLRAVQTPQGFRRDVLVAAHAASGSRQPNQRAATDDAGLVEALGVQIVVVEGSGESFKITTSIDLATAEAMVHR